MSWLVDRFSALLSLAGVPVYQRRSVDFSGACTVTDNPGKQRTDIVIGGSTTAPVFGDVTFPPETAPASPASGWKEYTDVADGALKAKKSDGTVQVLAPAPAPNTASGWDPVTAAVGNTIEGAGSKTIATAFYCDGSVPRTIKTLRTLCANPGNTTVRLQLWTATGSGTATQYETHDVVSNGSAERLVSVALTTPLVMVPGQIYIVGAWDTDAAHYCTVNPTAYVMPFPNWNYAGDVAYGTWILMAQGLWLFNQFSQISNSNTVPPYHGAAGASAVGGGAYYPVSVGF